jgi:hypothetical protein
MVRLPHPGHYFDGLFPRLRLLITVFWSSFSFAGDFATVVVFACYVVEANLDKSACFLNVVGYFR